jgi:chemotaxis protein MotB
MSTAKKDKRPIIIKKVTSGHGGHHGGAWKVAYADFVTAMMAFFMVMWIMGMDPSTKDSVQGYFQNPVGFKKAFGGGANPLSSGNSMMNQSFVSVTLMSRDYQTNQFNVVAQRIRSRLEKDAVLKKLAGNFDISVTSEGLRIEISDAGEGDTFFALSSAAPSETAIRAFNLVGEELADLENMIALEGHTDALQYGRGSYSNWELSVDRANAARRLIVSAGVDIRRISEVRGLADRDLRFPKRPHDPANRRVSFLIPFAPPGDGSMIEMPVNTGETAAAGATVVGGRPTEALDPH